MKKKVAHNPQREVAVPLPLKLKEADYPNMSHMYDFCLFDVDVDMAFDRK